MDYMDKIKTILLENINLSGIVSSIIDEVLEEALNKAVEASPNAIDDMLMASIYPILEKELKSLINEKLSGLNE